MHKRVLVVALFVVGLAASSTAQEKTTVENAVKHCVDVVHRFTADETDKRFFQKFDAFYNPAKGQVENNAVMVGDQEPLYQFNKCMTSQGYPLSYNK
jgi:hypothetical protein